MKLRNVKKLIVTAALAVSMACSGVCCYAEPDETQSSEASASNDAVVEARNGVVRVGVYYYDSQTGTYDLIKSGSGFLIGKEGTAGASTVLTNYHVVNLTADEAEEFKAYKNLDNLSSSDLVVRVAVKRDTCIKASILNDSEASDFAVLSLETPINKKPLKFAAENSTSATQTVYALGFPGVLTYVQDDNTYTVDDVNVTKGTVSKITQLDSLEYIQHDADLSEGNSGGPIVDDEGYVVGINVSGLTENNVYYSLSEAEVTEVLDLIRVDYGRKGVDPTPTGEPIKTGTPSEIDYSKLQAEIDKFEDAKEDDYTAESYAEYKEAADAGKDLIDAAETQEEVDDATADIKSVAAGLEKAEADEEEETEESEFPLIPVVAGAAVVVIIIVVVIIVVVSNGKKKEKAQGQAPTAGPVVQPRPVNNSNSDATTVLSGGGDAPTTMLNGGPGTPSATLVRLRTNENIVVNRSVYGIGKDQNRVDYCISGNTSISRRHAEIRIKNGAFYLADLNSTNGTFLNGQRLQMNQEMILKNNDRIKISDEEFQFKM